MGGRGSTIRGGGGTSINATFRDLISERERAQKEVDQVLTVLRDIQDEFGEIINAANVATIKGRGKNTTLGFYTPSTGEVSINNTYWANEKMEDAYQRCVANGFHPSNGSKSGLEAVFAHEMGHALNDAAAAKLGKSLHDLANEIVKEASGVDTRAGNQRYAANISRYAKHNNAEAVAEAYADVYCNGNKAKSESQAIVNILKRHLGR